MMTTVALDDDVAAALQERARERGLSLKAVLTDAVRAGLAPRRAKRYRVPSGPLGLRPGIDLDKALSFGDILR